MIYYSVFSTSLLHHPNKSKPNKTSLLIWHPDAAALTPTLLLRLIPFLPTSQKLIVKPLHVPLPGRFLAIHMIVPFYLHAIFFYLMQTAPPSISFLSPWYHLTYICLSAPTRNVNSTKGETCLLSSVTPPVFITYCVCHKVDTQYFWMNEWLHIEKTVFLFVMPKGFHAIYLITKSKDLDKLIRSEIRD